MDEYKKKRVAKLESEAERASTPPLSAHSLSAARARVQETVPLAPLSLSLVLGAATHKD